MYRHNFQPNPYSGGPGFNGPEGAYRSPMDRPRYQSSPRYHQQFISPSGGPSPPDFTPGRGPPRYHPHPPGPRGGFNSPPHMSFDGPSPHSSQGFRGSNRGRKFSSPGHHGHGMGRGKQRDSPSSNRSDHNPGGSDDIRIYYNPSMTQDPWANLQPVAAHASSSGRRSNSGTPSRT